MLQAFLMGYFLMQCENLESRFYKALKIVLRNPGKAYLTELINPLSNLTVSLALFLFETKTNH